MSLHDRMAITEDELEFLRYFYTHVEPALGPASGDVYDSLKKQYERDTGEKVPPRYT